MRKLSLHELAAGGDGPVVSAAVPGHVAERGGVSSYQAGQRTHPEGRHVHDVPEVFCILQGSGVVEIDGVATGFHAGDVLVIAPGEDHHLVSQGELPLVSMWLHMRPA
jgi:mannose-6-phosphate isomerase-like protein (cupin superfamily)